VAAVPSTSATASHTIANSAAASKSSSQPSRAPGLSFMTAMLTPRVRARRQLDHRRDRRSMSTGLVRCIWNPAASERW
jgi:hypothetical protein